MGLTCVADVSAESSVRALTEAATMAVVAGRVRVAPGAVGALLADPAH